MNRIVINQLGQTLNVTLKSETPDAPDVNVSLAPYGRSEPFAADRLTDYTKGLAQQGHVRVIDAE